MRYQTGSQKWITIFADPISAIFSRPCIALIGKDGELDDTTLCDRHPLCTETEDEKIQHEIVGHGDDKQLFSCVDKVVVDAPLNALRQGGYSEDNFAICQHCLDMAKTLKLVSESCDGRKIC